MILSVVIGGQRHKISQSDTIGVGGEATVVSVDNRAIKIYHSPTPDRITKLKNFIDLDLHLPSFVCAPKEIVYDVKSNPVGFAMDLLTGHHEVVQKLSSRNFRKTNPHVDARFITELFINGYETTAACHKAGLVVGDFSDLNVLFQKTYMTFIDVDSFQFKNHPCMAGTENFLDPSLYNIDLARQPSFKPEHDWYAWYCMFIRSLLLVHPYGGVHRKYATIPQRAVAKISCFHPEVKYPKAAYTPDLLNNSLRDQFEKVFERGERFVFPIEVLHDYSESLKECISCKSAYPSDKKNCPHCATINTQQIQRKIRATPVTGQKVLAEELISISGDIVWHKTFKHTIFAVALENKRYVLYSTIYPTLEGRYPKRTDLFGSGGQIKFDMFDGKYLVVNEYPSDEVLIFNVSTTPIIKCEKKPISRYEAEAAFACSEHQLWRVFHGFIFRNNYSIRYTHLLEDNVSAVIENQTWIAASSNGSSVFGTQRIFNVLTYFNYHYDHNPRGEFWSDTLELNNNEAVIDRAAYFYKNAVLLLLKTEILGKTYTRLYAIQNGRVTTQNKIEAMSSDIYRNIHGKAFVLANDKIIIIHPTDDGIVQESIINGQSSVRLLSDTEPFVNETDSIVQYQSGVLVINSKSVNLLTLQA